MEMNGQPNAERERERERAGWKIIEAVLSQCSVLTKAETDIRIRIRRNYSVQVST
jgi:hypothetical protein